jgi:hypothetical protein
MTNKLLIGNIQLIINSSEYNSFQDSEYNSINNVFATNNNGLGGYSFAHAQGYCKQFKELPQVYDFSDVHKKNLERNYHKKSYDIPKIFLCEVVKNDFTSSKNLMDNIIRFTIRNEYHSIRLFNLIHLNSNQNFNTFEGIKASIIKRKFERNRTIVFDVDKEYFDEFCSHFKDYPYKNALYDRFEILTYLFYNELNTDLFKNYLKKLIELLYSENKYEEVSEACSKLLCENRERVKENYLEFQKSALYEEYIFYKGIKDAKYKKIYKKFVFDSIELFIYLCRTFNQLDLLKIAYYCREFEYDVYADDILNNLQHFDSISKVEKFIIQKFRVKRAELKKQNGRLNSKIKVTSEKIFKKITSLKKKYAYFLTIH